MTNLSIVSQDKVSENQVLRSRVAKTQQPDAERLKNLDLESRTRGIGIPEKSHPKPFSNRYYNQNMGHQGNQNFRHQRNFRYHFRSSLNRQNMQRENSPDSWLKSNFTMKRSNRNNTGIQFVCEICVSVKIEFKRRVPSGGILCIRFNSGGHNGSLNEFETG